MSLEADRSHIRPACLCARAQATVTMVVINAAAGVILVVVSFLLSAIQSGCVADPPLRWIFRLIPSYSLGNGLNMIASLDILPLLALVCDPNLRSSRVYDALDMDVTGANIIYLAVLGPAYLVLTIIVDTALTSPFVRGYLEAPPKRVIDAPVVDDEDVAAEKARVAATLAIGEHADSTRAIQIAGLRKVFRTLEGTPKVAVRDLWLGLEVGDVFGFLGVNGAGASAGGGRGAARASPHRAPPLPPQARRRPSRCSRAHSSRRAGVRSLPASTSSRSRKPCDASSATAPSLTPSSTR